MYLPYEWLVNCRSERKRGDRETYSDAARQFAEFGPTASPAREAEIVIIFKGAFKEVTPVIANGLLKGASGDGVARDLEDGYTKPLKIGISIWM